MNRRTVFNWSLLTRKKLYRILYGAGKSFVGKETLVKDIHSVLSTHIKNQLPIRVKSQKSFDTEPGFAFIGGAYYSEYDQCNQLQIEITFSYHPFDESLKITRYRWQRMCTLFADTVLHEIIHMRQFRARDFKRLPGYESTAYLAKQRKDQEYYGDSDEIGAFSFNIACELYSIFGDNVKAISNYLTNPSIKNLKKTCYYNYLKAFDFDYNHKIVKKVRKKVWFYLPYAKLGKPFLTNNYLTY